MKNEIAMNNFPHRLGSEKFAQAGMSLIVVLIMLIIIGVTASSAMRTATSEQRATNNLRVDALAQQYAEAALRYCEYQISQVADAQRPAGLRAANMPTTTPANSAWETVANWAAGSAILVTVPQNLVSDANTDAVNTRPQCIAELQSVAINPVPAVAPFSYTVVVITARGFSPDYVADANGITQQGAVVWLQSVINAN